MGVLPKRPYHDRRVDDSHKTDSRRAAMKRGSVVALGGVEVLAQVPAV
jgi:hypothetical protein